MAGTGTPFVPVFRLRFQVAFSGCIRAKKSDGQIEWYLRDQIVVVEV